MLSTGSKRTYGTETGINIDYRMIEDRIVDYNSLLENPPINAEGFLFYYLISIRYYY